MGQPAVFQANHLPEKRGQAWLRTIVSLERGELPLALLACTYFFCLLCGYYVVRPLRDEMGIEGGTAKLPYLFSVTFLVMLAAVPAFGWIVARAPRRRIVPVVYGLFALQLLAFFVLLKMPISRAALAPSFFVWVSVYNLFVVAVFWSYMVDVFSAAQARRLFGFIAAGGTIGAIAGPLLTQSIVRTIGPTNLLLVSVAFLLAALGCVLLINRQVERHGLPPAADHAQPIGFGVFSGVRRVFGSQYLFAIGCWVVLGNILGAFFYLQQQIIIEATVGSPAERIQLFARLDLTVNVLAIILQLLATGRIIQRFGVGVAAAAQPALATIGFLLLAAAPTLAVIFLCQTVGRAVNYAISNPARHALFSSVTPDEKYKAQNVVDTLFYRGGDAAGGWLFALLSRSLGLEIALIAAIATPFAALWTALAIALGRMQESHRPATEQVKGVAQPSSIS